MSKTPPYAYYGNLLMNNSPLSRQKKKSGSLVRIVFWLSLVLLVARLIWVLPAAFDHHRAKQESTGAATQAKSTP
ncbi:YfgG family protein [Tatumella ptyseos]|uniref:YfgG family protein n=1 Tax=Tatumella ptyseos TaxID=82987 RepID=UPI0026F29C0A|nr:YfgG family protein [Tatumella ptyseos]WKX25653.1 YfgG family protein [Tatumella ptyseos]